MIWAQTRSIRLSLSCRFEEEFGIEIPDEDAEKIQSVRDAVDYIEKHAKS